MAITASAQPESGRIVHAGSHFPHQIRFRFSKEDLDHIVQNRPGSDLDGLVRVWPNVSGAQESWGLVCGRTQPARYHFPTSRLGSLLPQAASIMLCKTRPDPIWLWLTVSGFGQTDQVRNHAGVQDSSGLFLAMACEPIRVGYESD